MDVRAIDFHSRICYMERIGRRTFSSRPPLASAGGGRPLSIYLSVIYLIYDRYEENKCRHV